MPVVTEERVTAYAHCVQPLCAGTFQEAVDAVRVETGYLFTDNGGDIPGVERSKVHLRFADEDPATPDVPSVKAPCPHCETRRELSETPRPQYERLSGHDPAGLLNIPRFDPNKVNAPSDQHAAEMDALREQLAELKAAVEGKAA